MNALDIARAACMEVGVDPYVIWWDDFDQVLRVHNHHPDLRAGLRAGWLAECASFGPTYATHCERCFMSYCAIDPSSACIPVRDALRGLTCGRWS